MKWTFDELLTFLDVMDTLSITATAARLNLSKSVVSKRISDLEQALSTSLFQRSPRRLTPTDSAVTLAARLQPLLRDITDATETAAAGPKGLTGRLRIAAPMSFGTLYLGRIIADFALAHPDLEIAVEFDDEMTDLVQSRFDVGVRIGTLADSSLIARKLCIDPRMVCASPHFLEQRGTPASIADLPRFDCIDYANVHTAKLWQFDGETRGAPPVSVAIRSRIVANNGEAMRDMAIAGLGLVLLPTFIVADSLRNGRLVRVLPDARPTPYTISAVFPPTRHIAPKVRAFVDHLARHITDPPLWQVS